MREELGFEERRGEKNDHHSKILKLAAWESVKQIQVAEVMGWSDLYKRRLQRDYCWEQENFFECAKEIRERGELAKVVYNRIVL